MTSRSDSSRLMLALAAAASVFVVLSSSCLNRTTDLGQPGDGSAALNPGSDPTNVQCDRRFYSEGLRITTPRCVGYNVKGVELQGDACDKRLDVGVGDLVWILGKSAGPCHVTVTYGNGKTFSTDTVFSLVRDDLCGDYYKGSGHFTDPASCFDAGTGQDAALSAPATCKLEDVLAADIGGMPIPSCGKFDIHATADELTAAKNCVLAAVQAFEPFQVQWDVPGADSRVAHAYVGLVGEETSLEIRSYSYDGNRRGVGEPESLPSTWISRCGSLRAKDSCAGEELRYTLCLECATPVQLPGCLTM